MRARSPASRLSCASSKPTRRKDAGSACGGRGAGAVAGAARRSAHGAARAEVPPTPGPGGHALGVAARRHRGGPRLRSGSAARGTSLPRRRAQRRAPRSPPKQLFSSAMANFRAHELGQAVLELTNLITRFPDHALAASAQVWIGEAYYQAA